jgi:hypothetical protein
MDAQLAGSVLLFSFVPELVGCNCHQGRQRRRPPIAQGHRNIGSQQTAFDAELAAIEQAISWFLLVDKNGST